jgi:voltage-gated potassium channel
MGILLLEFGSLAILHLEQFQSGANITTGSDAIWYVLVTISTVGYGDQFPVTNQGRLLGALIIGVGVGIFGTFTGYLANFFLAPQKKVTVPETVAEVDVRSKVAELRELIAHQQSQQQAAMDEIERLLAPDNV